MQSLVDCRNRRRHTVRRLAFRTLLARVRFRDEHHPSPLADGAYDLGNRTRRDPFQRGLDVSIPDAYDRVVFREATRRDPVVELLFSSVS